MLRKAFVLVGLGLLLVPAAAQAQFQAGNWEITLTGNGTSEKAFRGSSFTAGGSVGYFLTKELELSGRQSVGYAKVKDGPEDYIGSSAAALDFHFDLGVWQPFIGANVGAIYGKNRTGSAEAGPEGGIKFFVNQSTFIYVLVAYEISLNNSDFSTWAY